MNEIVKKRKSIIFISVAIMILLIVFGVMFMNNHEVYADKVVRVDLEKIHESIEKEFKNNSLSDSSPFSHIENNEYYDEIIELGVAALPELENELQSSDISGLDEYIMALAMSEISGTDVSLITKGESYSWSNAKQFLAEWKATKELVEIDITMLLMMDNMTEKELRNKISPYGVLAIPVICDVLSDEDMALTPDQKSVYKKELNNIVNEAKLSKNEIKLLKGIVPENSVGFDAAK